MDWDEGVGKLFLDSPPYRTPSQFPASGWTETVEGYLRESRELARCLERNRRLSRRKYSWHVVVSISTELSAAAHADLWRRTSRKLRDRNVVALWVREPTRSNKLHYHLLVFCPADEGELKWAIEEAMPSRSIVRWRKRVETIRDHRWVENYIVKAKYPGRIRGKYVEDKNRRKRLLLKPGTGMNKFGVIGPFWADGRSKTALWGEIRVIEAKISKGLKKPNIDRLIQHIDELTGRCLGSNRIARRIGFSADTQAVQRWIDWLLETDGDHWAASRGYC